MHGWFSLHGTDGYEPIDMRIGQLWLIGDVATLHVKIDNLNDLVVWFCLIRDIDFKVSSKN